jgi:hydroxymethylglutaryl-CoA synthase
VWNADAQSIAGWLRGQEKSVQDMDENTATIAVEAARNVVNRAEIWDTHSFTADTPDF